jgi:predicted Zn finger-like uncharacterized protein
MIITCDSCHTKFRLDSARLKPGRSKVRCSRCGHTFFVGQEEQEDEILRFDPMEDPYPPAQGLAASPRVEVPETQTPPSKAKRDRKGLIKATGIVLGLALLIAGIIWFVKSQATSSLPEATPQPKTTAQQAQPPNITILESTQAYFLENASTGQIFVVEGEIVNDSPKPVSFVMLEGKLYTKANQVAQSQKCYVGNRMSRSDLTKLNISEIQNRMMNREGKDMSDVQIAPAKHVPFMLIFHNLPEVDALTDYSVEVVSAE